MHVKLIALHENEENTRSPIVFAHGFPDSPEMFAAYHTDSEKQQEWLQDRNIYAIAFPNRHTHPEFPSLWELITLQMRQEFAQHISDLIKTSPTGKIVPIVHDLGATYMWRYIRQHGDRGIDRMVSLSVASSFRYDIWEHGIFALTWLYSLIYILPYYLPFAGLRKFLANTLVTTAGYESETADNVYKDVFHYWYAPLWLIRFPAFLIPTPVYTSFTFPVMYIRSKLDRIASTIAFENLLNQRDDCEIYIWDEVNHWFPEQHSEEVLEKIRVFLRD